MTNLSNGSPLRRFIRLITFIDLPIKKKFTLFGFGVLFWFLVMAGVAFFAFFSIDLKYSSIVGEVIPQDRVVQKIIRNLQSLSIDVGGIARTNDLEEMLRLSDITRKRLEDVRQFAATLALGGGIDDISHETGKLLERVETASLQNDPKGVAFLRELTGRIAAIDSAAAEFIDAKREALQHGNPDPDLLFDLHSQTEALLYESNLLAVGFSAELSARYADGSRRIGQLIGTTTMIMVAVLLIASLLLAIFSVWISDAIARPIKSIIRQIHSLGSGDVDLTMKIEITSRDEIGTLSTEFNELMETVYNMTTFKKVIEEDGELEDVYARLGEIFRKEAGIDQFVIYEVKNNQREMTPVHPLLLSHSELPSDPEILANCDLCRAKKTGHPVSSLSFPGICKQFRSDLGKEHVCIPMNVGGRVGGVVQFLFDRPDEGEIDSQGVHARIFKAETYINQSLSVIEAKRLMQTLRESALKDPMTGLYNRRFLQDHAATIIAGITRRGTTLGLAMCDLDYFKQVNDKYGHDTGDSVLRETATVILNSVRESDFVIRFGGEEFLVLLVDIQPGEAVRVAEKIRTEMQGHKFKMADGVLKKTISLGVCEFPGDTEGFWQAIKYADVALYRAKTEGRNQVVRFLPAMWAGDQF